MEISPTNLSYLSFRYQQFGVKPLASPFGSHDASLPGTTGSTSAFYDVETQKRLVLMQAKLDTFQTLSQKAKNASQSLYDYLQKESPYRAILSDKNNRSSGQVFYSKEFSSTNRSLGLSTSFTLNGKTIQVFSRDTLQDIRNRINNVSQQTQATATIDDKNRLVITSFGTSNRIVDLKDTFSFNGVQSSNPSIASVQSTNFATSDNKDWTQTLSILSTSQQHAIRSNTVSSVSTALNLTGAFQVNSTTINVVSNDTLTDIVGKVNGSQTDVRASINENNQLVFTSVQTGSSSVFSVQDLTGGSSALISSNPLVATLNSVTLNENWTHTVEVTELAKSFSVSTNTVADINSSLYLAGSFRLTQNGQTADVSVVDSDSLQTIMSKINAAGLSIQASIANNKLTLTSTKTGTSYQFTVMDLTTPAENLTNSNSVVATVNTTGNANRNWSHTVSLVYTPDIINDEFTSNTIANFTSSYNNTASTSNWSVVNGVLKKEYKSTSVNEQSRILNNATKTDDNIRYIEADLKIVDASSATNDQAGVYLNFIDTNNFTRAYVDTNTRRVVLETVKNGVSTLVQSSTNSNIRDNRNFMIAAYSDYSGYHNVDLYYNGTKISSVTANWTNATINGGKTGFYAKGNEVQFDYMYSETGTHSVNVDGVSTLVRSSNDLNVTLKSSDNSTDATISVKKAGTTVITHTDTDAVLKDIGLLTSANAYTNVVSQAKNLSYKLDGSLYSSASNTVAASFGTFTASGLGTSILQHQKGNPVLKTIGMVGSNNTAQYIISTGSDLRYQINNGPVVQGTSPLIDVKNSQNQVLATVMALQAGTVQISKTQAPSFLNIVTFSDQTAAAKEKKKFLSSYQQAINEWKNFLTTNQTYFHPLLVDQWSSALSQHMTNLRNIHVSISTDNTVDFSRLPGTKQSDDILRDFSSLTTDLFSSITKQPYDHFLHPQFLPSLIGYQQRVNLIF